ncbi:MAG: cation:proton antiporter [Rhodospirillales bacterium]|nr:cation:proton antiporter [Rhodospirillales bacterium]MDH3965653.1 cation:proton antiporter [Rhodospirillales bacterium]
MELFAELLVLLLATRALGEAAERLGQPASVGELSAGILLAIAAARFGHDLPFLERLATSEALEYAANLGIFFLVLLAGVELDPEEILDKSRGAFVVALGGMALPLLGGLALAWVFLPESELKQGQVLLVGVALSISAIPATVKVFTDLGLLHARVGETVISAAVFDDILGLFLLAVLLAVLQTGQVPDLATLGLLLAKVAGFFVITVALGTHVYPRVRRGLKLMQAAAMEFSALVAVALAYGFLAELLNLHWILGAFMAGLYFAPSRVGPAAYTEMKAILTALTSGILGPLFFTSIGLRVNLGTVTAVPLFLSLLIAVAFFGKVVGAGLPALWAGLGRREALAVGVGMSARGAVELVVISIAYEAGLFAPSGAGDPLVAHLFSSLILMAVVTTLLTPIILRRILPKTER